MSMGCFGIVTAWLESHRTKKPDGTANQNRKQKKAEKKMRKEMKERARKEKKAAAKGKKAEKKQQQPSRTSDRRHRSPPPTPAARRPLRSPPPARCMTPMEMVADLADSAGLNVNVSGSGIAYTLDFRPGTPALRPHRLQPLRRRRCAFSFEDNALMQDILRQEQIIKRKEIARQESVKRLEAERRRQETQAETCVKVKQGESKFVKSVGKRKKNLKKLAQTTLNLRADLVLKSVRTRRAMKELERREEMEVLDEKGEEEGEEGDHE